MTVDMKRSQPCIANEAEDATGLTSSPDASTYSIGNQLYSYWFHPSFNIDTRGSYMSTRSVRVSKSRGSTDESDTTVLSNLPTVYPISRESKEQKRLLQAKLLCRTWIIKNSYMRKQNPSMYQLQSNQMEMILVHSRSIMAIKENCPCQSCFSW